MATENQITDQNIIVIIKPPWENWKQKSKLLLFLE